VKNRYFGDTRDLFKYDLILELLLKNDFLERFTFIPMLTEDTHNFHGGRTNYDHARAGTQREELRSFLARCVAENRRNIGQLEGFFNSGLPRKVDFTIYRKNEHFSHEARARYFSEIGERFLSRSAILIDPDIGLEVKSMRGREQSYIAYAEVEFLFKRMDRNSVLIVFQFIPRVKRGRYLSHIGRKLKRTLYSSPVLYISDNQVAFFLLTKDVDVQRQVTSTINEYSRTYGLVTGKI
jgi:hypothetical protein